MHGLHVEILHDLAAVATPWHALFAQGTSTAYQTYDWIKIACETFERQNTPVILYATQDNEPAFLIPLMLERGFPSILRWPGNNHANIGCGLFSRKFLAAPPDGLMPDLMRFVNKTLPGTILLHLKNQPAELSGFPNPILAIPSQAGPNPLFPIDLTKGFDFVLDQGNGKRKRKLFRRQCRVADHLGGWELSIPDTQEEISFTIDEFFRLKTSRFTTLGVNDVFSSQEAKDLLTRLALQPEKDGIQPLRLFVLKVAGTMRAMYGTCTTKKRCYSFINAVEYDEFSEESPGEMVLYLMIEHLVNSGFEYFDIGIGQERYKHSWCKEPSTLQETVYPMGMAAKPIALYIKLLTAMKERIKANPAMWGKIKQFRRIRSRLFFR